MGHYGATWTDFELRQNFDPIKLKRLLFVLVNIYLKKKNEKEKKYPPLVQQRPSSGGITTRPLQTSKYVQIQNKNKWLTGVISSYSRALSVI